MNMRPFLIAVLVATSLRLSAQSPSSLPRSTPERQGIPSRAILSFVQAADSSIDAMHSVMIVRHGKVVAEGWWSPNDTRTPHMLYSLSKSFTSTAVGLAVAEGKLQIDAPVLSFFPAESPATPTANLRALRVRDLLRMSTGQISEARVGFLPDSTLPPGTWVQRFLAHPIPYKPGTHFLYNSPATYMLSAIVQKATGQTVLDYLQPRLFAPLGIERPTWVTSPEGIDAGAYGLSARTEDIAKLGLLYLRRGDWNGTRILPASWVDSATTRQTSNGSDPASDWDQGYGFQFWRSRHGYRGDGAFGQYMLVLPEQDAVVAITSGVRDMQAVMNLVWTLLLPAIRAEPLPDDGVAQRALRGKLNALTMRTTAGRASSPLAASVSGRWYTLPANDRGIQAIALDLSSPAPALLVRSSTGETRTPFGSGAWVRSESGFTNGMERFLAVPPHPAVAASGAWAADSVFTLKLVTIGTPYYSTMTFGFHGDSLSLDGRYNVSFFPTTLARLEGVAAPVR